MWVAHNAGYKLQTVSDAVIETYNSINEDTKLAAQVTKEPMGGGKYKILVRMWCDNALGCFPNPWDAELNFNQTVSAAQP